MAVYVDPLMHFGAVSGFFKGKKSCHLLADSKEELMKVALAIGMKEKWYQLSKSGIPHFDLIESRRVRAIKEGAVEISSRELLSKMNEIREKYKKGNF